LIWVTSLPQSAADLKTGFIRYIQSTAGVKGLKCLLMATTVNVWFIKNFKVDLLVDMFSETTRIVPEQYH
jgi:hypothetical protein